MSDLAGLDAAYKLFKQATYWAATGKLGKGYGVAYAAEAKLIDEYIAALAAGQTPTPPTLSTKHGSGLVAMIAAGIAPVPEPPPVPDPPPALTVISSIKNGQELSTPLTWEATPSAAVTQVQFLIDGVTRWNEGISPYIFNGDGKTLDPASLTAGSHVLEVLAIGPTGTARDDATVTVKAPATTPPPTPTPTGKEGRVGLWPDMSGGYLDASAQNTAHHQAWLDNYGHVLAYGGWGSSYVTPWYPRAMDYIDSYAIYTNSVGTLDPLILRDSSGNRVYIDWRDPDGAMRQYAADVGNQGWKDEILRRCKDALAKGYQGIYFDDVNLTFRFSNGTTTTTPIDPRTGQLMTLDNWKRYFVEFLEFIRAQLPNVPIGHNSIWFSGPNHDGADPYSQRQFKAANFVTYERGFNDGGLHAGTDEWSFDRYMKHMDNVHACGANIYTLSYGTTRQEAKFNLGSTLLVSKGGDFHTCRYAWIPPGIDALYKTDLGGATGPRYAGGTNIVKRDFDKGTVSVDFGARTATIPGVA